MKKLLFSIIAIVAAFGVTGCRMAPSSDNGDTVAAKEFYPPDTTLIHKKRLAKAKALAQAKDSTDIFVVGPASNRQQLQLISYPSHRDTVTYGRTRHIRVTGNADVGRVVRITLWTTEKGDTLVKQVESLSSNPQKNG